MHPEAWHAVFSRHPVFQSITLLGSTQSTLLHQYSSEMVHYIKLLSCPRASNGAGFEIDVSVVAAITTDLGDDLLWRNVALNFQVVCDFLPEKVLAETQVVWDPRYRVVKTRIPCAKRHMDRRVKLHISPVLSSQTQPPISEIVDIWSSSFMLRDSATTEPYVQRHFEMTPTVTLKFNEELGDSIARHLWYAPGANDN